MRSAYVDTCWMARKGRVMRRSDGMSGVGGSGY